MICQALAIFGATTERTMDTFQDKKGKLYRITNADIENVLKIIVQIIGEEELEIFEGDIGTHTNHSIAAMWMYLNNVRTYTIILIGCWG